MTYFKVKYGSIGCQFQYFYTGFYNVIIQGGMKRLDALLACQSYMGENVILCFDARARK